jgi:ABC-type Fe3+ transport system permease subunit
LEGAIAQLVFLGIPLFLLCVVIYSTRFVKYLLRRPQWSKTGLKKSTIHHFGNAVRSAANYIWSSKPLALASVVIAVIFGLVVGMIIG